MLIKLRFIGVLFILLLSTSEARPLQELQKELDYWEDVVENTSLQFFPQKYYYNRHGQYEFIGPPRILLMVEGIKIWLKVVYGSDKYLYVNSNFEPSINYDLLAMDQGRTVYQIRREIEEEYMRLASYSGEAKQGIKEWRIPEIQKAIRNHPDNPNNPNSSNYHLNPIDYNVDPVPPGPEPIGATHCHSVGPSGKGFMVGTKQLGNWCSYHQNGRLSKETPYAHEKRHGTVREYFDNGKRRAEYTYFNGKKNGKKRVWYRSGEYQTEILKSEHNYEDDQLHGEARTWYQNGNPSTCWIYNYGQKFSQCPL